MALHLEVNLVEPPHHLQHRMKLNFYTDAYTLFVFGLPYVVGCL